MGDVDEWELEQYLNSIDAIDELLGKPMPVYYEESIDEQLRDENGFRVPGAYRTLPKQEH